MPPTAAVLYDIHGNLPALEAVIAEIRRERIDRIVCGGDVLPGPMPRETIDYLRGLDIPITYIRGNGDREILERLRGQETDAVPEPFREILRWNARQLNGDDERWIGEWPSTTRVDVPGLGDVLFCHATPHSDLPIFTRETADERVTTLFDGVTAPLVVCGHTHMQFDRAVGRMRIVNAGSVGMPFGAPGAYWLALGPGVELRRTEYDLNQAAQRIRASEYPQAGEFAARNVLQPPSEEQMLAAFEGAARR
jgi:predicted phosphodiesterase